MRTWKRWLGVLALPVLLCAACSDPHSGDWAPQSPPDTTQAMPSPSTSSSSPEPSRSATAPSEQASVTPLSELEQWLLQGFQDAGYASSTVRVHGTKDAWVGSGSEESAPERFAHAWPAGKTDLYADDGTELRTTSVGDVQVHVLQHVWGVSARFECGTVMVDTYAQSQLEQHQAEAEALSLAGVLMAPLDCAGDGFEG